MNQTHSGQRGGRAGKRGQPDRPSQTHQTDVVSNMQRSKDLQISKLQKQLKGSTHKDSRGKGKWSGSKW